MDRSSCFKNIEYEDGIWLSHGKRVVESAFSDEEQDGLYSLEDASWWFRYRAEVISRIAEPYFKKKQFIFDVGGMATQPCICKREGIAWLCWSLRMVHAKMQKKGEFTTLYAERWKRKISGTVL